VHRLRQTHRRGEIGETAADENQWARVDDYGKRQPLPALELRCSRSCHSARISDTTVLRNESLRMCGGME